MRTTTDKAFDRQEAAGIDSPQAGFEALLARHRGIVLKVASIYCLPAGAGFVDGS
jgi:hypothetical protein